MRSIAIVAGLIVTFGFALTVVQGNHETGCSDTTPDFTDSCYHEYLLYNMDQPEVDVLILPSSSPYVLRDLVLMEQSIQNWDDGINDLAPTWLASALNIHYYTVGFDIIPVDALWDPEVIVIPAEFNPVLLAGIGLEPWQQLFAKTPCHGKEPPLLIKTPADIMGAVQGITENSAFHEHEGADWGMLMTECNAGGTTCFVINTNFLWLPDVENRANMYDLNSHEFGHCLGIGHVGDALDFSASSYPPNDIMSYELDSTVKCVSTLNIRALEHIYGDMLLGGNTYPEYPASFFTHMASSGWSAYACDQPTATPTTLPPLP